MKITSVLSVPLFLVAAFGVPTTIHPLHAQPVKPKIALVYSPSTNAIPASLDSDEKSRIAGYLQSGDSVEVISYEGGKYCKIALPPGLLANEGYVIISAFKYDSIMVEYVNTRNKDASDPLRLPYVPPTTALTELVELNSIAYKRQHKPRVSESTGYSSGNSSAERVIHTGPRGGRYYINKNGNKTYIKD